MREKKFRVWDRNAKTMSNEPGYIQIDGYGNFSVFDDESGEWQEDGKYSADLTLMQYTGLKDKKGVEIFEGDILQYESHGTWENHEVIFVVEYENLNEDQYIGAYFLKDANGYKRLICNIHRPYEYAEIIGNIYENLELLPKTDKKIYIAGKENENYKMST